MTTLKDFRKISYFETPTSTAELISLEELKTEAVEWVKDDKRRIKLGNINVEILLRRWMVRLNIVEEIAKEDLK